MAGIYQTTDAQGKPHPKWRFWYTDWRGKRVWQTGTTDPIRTQRIAESIEDEQKKLRRDIELGIRQPPDSAELARPLSIAELMGEYIAWGEAQGGRGGRPWSKGHARMRRTRLQFWLQNLGLKTVSDLDHVLPRVEKILRNLKAKPKKKEEAALPASGKTKMHHAEALSAFCDWLIERGYLSHDPLKGLAPFDTTPATQRRAMTSEELHALLNGCAPFRRLLYEVAFCTGLRAGELRALRRHHLDVARGGLILENRKPGFQPLAAELVERLAEAARVKLAWSIYQRFDAKTTYSKAEDALLYVGANPARDMQNDFDACGLAKWGPGGKIDFHAARVAYDNFVLQTGASVKEAQHLMRHSDPRLTMNTYGRVRDHRLSTIAEEVGKLALPVEDCGMTVERLAAGAEGQPQVIEPQGVTSGGNDGGGGNRTPLLLSANGLHEINTCRAQSQQNITLTLSNSEDAAQNAGDFSAESQHLTIPKCGKSVERETLDRLLVLWPALPRSIQQDIVKQAEDALRRKGREVAG